MQFYPLSFDQRHSANAYTTFSFQDKEGPWGFAPQVFQNSFISLLFKYGSGYAYTYNPTRKRYETNLNNARLPDVYTIDLQSEKFFNLGKIKLGVFFEVYNLLNRENVRSVYSYTGLPDDSGEPESYEYVADPLNYYPPRVFYLGVSLGI